MRVRSRQALGVATLILSLLGLLLFSAAAGASWMPSYPQEKSSVWALGDGGLGDNSLPLLHLTQWRPARAFFYLGDVYENGTALDFQENYGFESLAEKTAPVIGNHEWDNRQSGYYPYWAALRGTRPPNYYSFWVSGWQILVLNTEESLAPGSSQYAWLQERLRRQKKQKSCRIVLSHRPRWSASLHGDFTPLSDVVDLLNGRARLWLSGHDHNMQYIRRAGIEQLISGAGGRSFYQVDESYPGLRFMNDSEDGALRLVLRKRGKIRTAYWKFYNSEQSPLRDNYLRCRVA